MPFTSFRYDYQSQGYPSSKRDVISNLSLSVSRISRFPLNGTVTCPNGAPRALVSDRRSVCALHPRPQKLPHDSRKKYRSRRLPGIPSVIQHRWSLGHAADSNVRISGTNQPIDTKQSALSKARHRLSLRRPFEFTPLTFEAEFFVL